MGSNAWLKSAWPGRRSLAREDRPRLWAVIDEAVIHRVVGGPDVMCEQLWHLIESAQEGKTTIQVVPYRAGWGARLNAPARTGPGR